METEQQKLSIHFSREQNCCIMEIKGQINFSDLPELQEKVNETLIMPEKNILVDFSDVTYISSAGLRIFLKLGKEAPQTDKNLILFSLNEFITSIFKVSGLNKIFNIQPDKATALQTAQT